MTTKDFLTAVEAIAAARPSYRAGGDGSDGACDCIGLIIGAARRCGCEWPGLHGSNWTARNAVKDIHSIIHSENDCLQIGELVFKTRLPLDADWDLPARYAGDSDQADYYHVGVVTGVSPLRIVHCTTPGIVIDDNANDWDFAATLTLLDEARTALETRYVTAVSGSTVNLRRTPGGALLVRIPIGTQVQVEATRGEWSRLTHNGRTGWMLSKYLQAGESADRMSLLEQAVSELRNRVAELEAMR